MILCIQCTLRTTHIQKLWHWRHGGDPISLQWIFPWGFSSSTSINISCVFFIFKVVAEITIMLFPWVQSQHYNDLLALRKLKHYHVALLAHFVVHMHSVLYIGDESKVSMCDLLHTANNFPGIIYTWTAVHLYTYH